MMNIRGSVYPATRERLRVCCEVCCAFQLPLIHLSLPFWVRCEVEVRGENTRYQAGRGPSGMWERRRLILEQCWAIASSGWELDRPFLFLSRRRLLMRGRRRSRGLPIRRPRLVRIRRLLRPLERQCQRLVKVWRVMFRIESG